MDNALELLSLDESLDDNSKDLIKTAIPELIVETPTTPLAAAKYNKGISKANQPTINLMQQLLKDVICECAKKILFA